MRDKGIKCKYQLFELDDGTVFSSADVYWLDIDWRRVVKITVVLRKNEYVFDLGDADCFVNYRSRLSQPEYIAVSELHKHFKYILHVDDIKHCKGQYFIFRKFADGSDLEELVHQGDSKSVDKFIAEAHSCKHVPRGQINIYLRRIEVHAWVVGTIKNGIARLTDINFKTGEKIREYEKPVSDDDVAQNIHPDFAYLCPNYNPENDHRRDRASQTCH